MTEHWININSNVPPEGSKGKGGGTPRVAKEAPNTLRSRATARVLDAISEGEIGGLVNGAQSIFFNDTPVNSADGSNFEGFSFDQRVGLPDQPYMPGFPSVESETAVSVNVTNGNPVIRQVTSTDIDAMRVAIRLQALWNQDKTNGDINGHSVQIAIDTRPENGVWTEVVNSTIDGKTMNPYEIAWRVERPSGADLWETRVRRISEDDPDSSFESRTQWARYTEIQDVKEDYPNTAYIGIAVDAESTGGQIPRRSFLVDGIKCRIPDNYDPVTHTYTGEWSGTFAAQRYVTDDPAWIIYEILTNERFGLGEFIKDSMIDKWSFYEASKYNNEDVDDGAGGLEPRYRFATEIRQRQASFKLCQAIASTCRSALMDSAGEIKLVQDRPTNVVRWVTNEDVIDGMFEYSSSSLQSRTTSVNVTYNDANDKYLPRTITEDDATGINRYGFNEQDIVAYGAFTEGQARRMGKWYLYNNLNSQELLSFRSSLNMADLEPGDVVEVMDKDYAGVDWGGRVAGGNASSIQLDTEIEITTSDTHTIHILLSDGITWESRTIQEGPGTYTTVTLTSALSEAPTPSHSWVIEGSINARPFKILGIREVEPTVFEFNCIFHEANKYAAVEQGIVTDGGVKYADFGGNTIAPVTNITFTVEQAVDNLQRPVNSLRINWEPPADEDIKGYLLKWRRNKRQFNSSEFLTQQEFVIDGALPGEYDVIIFAYNQSNIQSPSAEASYTLGVDGQSSLSPPTNVRVKSTGDTSFTGREFTLVWDNPNSGTSTDQLLDYVVDVMNDSSTSALNTYTTTKKELLYTFQQNRDDHSTPNRDVNMWVYARDTLGRLSTPTQVTISNPAPELPTAASITGGFEAIFIDHGGDDDADLVGTVVWMSETSGFTRNSTTKVGEYPNTSFISVPAKQGVTHYVRFALYDEFGPYNLNVSAEYTVETNTADPSYVNPSTPTGLTLTTENYIGDNGQEYIRLLADWDDSADEITSYDVSIKEAGGTFVTSRTGESNYSWDSVRPGITYTVKVRANNVNVQSGFTAEDTITISGDATPPAAPSNLSAFGSFKNIFLSWINPNDKDLKHTEIWEATSNDRSTATNVATTDTDATTISGFDTAVTRYYWVRSVDFSGNVGAWHPTSATSGVSASTASIETADYADLSIVNAKIANLAVDNAKIADASVSTLKVQDAAITSAKIDTVEAQQVVVSGSTTLEDWRSGGDTTKIDGGLIDTNTIRTNSIEVGARNIRFKNIVWSPEKSNNTLNWTSGEVVYNRDSDNEPKAVSITGGSANYSFSTVYIYWIKDNTAFSTTTNAGVAYGSDRVVVATYDGQADYAILYGSTRIDGTNIVTGSITASQLVQTAEIIANAAQLGNAVVGNAAIKTAAIDEAKIQDAAISNAKIGNYIQSSNWNSADKTGWRIDKDSGIQGQDITIYDSNGNIALSAGGIDWNAISGTNKPEDNADVTGNNTANDVQYGSGKTVRQYGADKTSNNTADDVQYGSGKAVRQYGADKTSNNTANDVDYGSGKAVRQYGSDRTYYNTSRDTREVDGEDAENIKRWSRDALQATSVGDFAYLDKITSSNISSYFRTAAISTAFIQNGAIGTAQIQNAAIDTLRVKDKAVTSSSGQRSNGRVYSNGSWRTIIRKWHSFTGGDIILMGCCSGYAQSENRYETYIELALVYDGATRWHGFIGSGKGEGIGRNDSFPGGAYVTGTGLVYMSSGGAGGHKMELKVKIRNTYSYGLESGSYTENHSLAVIERIR